MKENSASTNLWASRRCERGQLLPFAAIGIVALLAMFALAVDVGSWRYQQRLEQSAADSAAVAGAIRLYYPSTAGNTAPVEVTAAAQSAARNNGFTDDGGVGNLTVTVDSPPLASPTSYPSNSAVEVLVMKKQPVFFSSIFGRPSQPISVCAVANIKSDGN